MHRDRRITAVVSSEQPGRCRYCQARIVWFWTLPKGRSMPFNPNPLVLSTSENPETQVKYVVLSSDALHFVTCTNKPTRTAQQPRLL